jgi:hypothetical protein
MIGTVQTTHTMKFYVSDISFDFSDSCYELSQNDKIDIIDDSIGLWEANDDDHLVEVITDTIGYCVETLSISECYRDGALYASDYEMDMSS